MDECQTTQQIFKLFLLEFMNNFLLRGLAKDVIFQKNDIFG